MRKLAHNDKVALYQCRNEYWYVVAGPQWHTGCINERSETYKGTDAMAWLEERYGPMTWKHKQITYW